MIVHGSHYQSTKVGVRAALAAHPSWLTQQLLACKVPPWPLAIAANLLPLVLLISWSAALMPAEPDRCWVYGLAPVLAGPATILATCGFLSWWLRSWRVSGRVVFAFALSLLLLLLLQLLLVVQRPSCAAEERLAEFPHTAMTAIAMALNLMPVSSILYLSLSESMPHAPVQSELKSTTSFALIVLGFRRSAHWPRLQAVASYTLSLVLLALYATTFFLAPATSAGSPAGAPANASSTGALAFDANSAAGFYASLTVVLLDICVWLYARAGLARSSLLPPILLMVAVRVALVVTGRFGVTYLFIVHSVIFFVAELLIGGHVTTIRFRESSSRKKRLGELIKVPHQFPRFLSMQIFKTLTMRKTPAQGHVAAAHGDRPAVPLPDFNITSPNATPAPRCSTVSAARASLVEETSEAASAPAELQTPVVDDEVSISLGALVPPSPRPHAPSPPRSPPESPPQTPTPRGASVPEPLGAASAPNNKASAVSFTPDPPRVSVASDVDVTIIDDNGDLGDTSAAGTASGSWTAHPETPLIYVVMLHVASLVFALYNRLAYPTLHPDIDFEITLKTSFAQWVLELAAGLAAAVILILWNLHLRLEFNGWILAKVKRIIASLFFLSTSLGALLIVADATQTAGRTLSDTVQSDTFTVFLVLLLGPAALLFGGRAVHAWHAGGLRLRTKDEERDRQLLVDIGLLCGCVLTFAVLVALTGNPQNAMVISVGAFVLILSCAALDKYMHTFRFDGFMLVCLAASVGLLVLLVVLYAVSAIEDRGRTNWVYAGAALYPTLFVFAWTILAWRAQFWRATRLVVVMLIVSMTLILALGVVVSLHVSFVFGGALLLLWLLCILSVTLSLLWARLSTGSGRVVFAIACAVALLLVLTVGFVLDHGMLAFSALCWIAIGSLSFYGLFTRVGTHRVRFGVLPNWSYDSHHYATHEANGPTLALFAAVSLLLGWGVFAAYTVLQASATLLSYLAAWLCYVIALHAMHRVQFDVRRLAEDLTPLMVAQGVKAVASQQAASIKLAMRAEERTFERKSSLVATLSIRSPSVTKSTSGRRMDRQRAARHALQEGYWMTCEAIVESLQQASSDEYFDAHDASELNEFGPPAQRMIEKLLRMLSVCIAKAEAEAEAQRVELFAAIEDVHVVRPAAADVESSEISRTTSVLAADDDDASRLVKLHAVDAQRWRLRAFGSCLAAHLLLVLRMCAELTTAEQDDALGGILAGGGAQSRAGAARIAAWPRAQREMIQQLRTLKVRRSSTDASMRTDDEESLERISKPERVEPSAGDERLVEGLGVGPNAYEWVRATELVPAEQHHAVCLFPPTDEQPNWRDLSVAPPPDAPSAAAEPVIAALRLLVAHPHAAARLRTLFSQSTLDAYGTYTVQLYSRTTKRWVSISIGDHLPCPTLHNAWRAEAARQEGAAAHVLPKWHACSGDPREIWAALLHKAIAQHCGSYLACRALGVPEVIVMLSGGLLQSMPLRLPDGVAPPPPAAVVQLWLRAGCLLMCEAEGDATTGHSSSPSSQSSGRTTGWRLVVDARDGANHGIHTVLSLVDAAGRTSHVNHAELGAVFERIHVVRCAFLWAETVLQGVVGLDDKEAELLSPVGAEASGGSSEGSTRRLVGGAAAALVSGSQSFLQRLSGRIEEEEGAAPSADAPERDSFAGRTISITPSTTSETAAAPSREASSNRSDSFASRSQSISKTISHSSRQSSRQSSRALKRRGSQMPRLDHLECKFQLEPALGGDAVSGEVADGLGVMIALVRESEDSEDGPTELLMTMLPPAATRTAAALGTNESAGERVSSSSSASALPSSALVATSAITLPIGFADEPGVGPTDALSGAVLRFAMGATQGGTVRFSVIIHAPRPLKATSYWTREERYFASQKLVSAWLARPGGKCHKLFKKVRSAEVGRRAATDEVLQVHTRFLGQLDVLAGLWRQQLMQLLAVEDNADGGDGAELVRGIFPYLDAIRSVSTGLLKTLQTCNKGASALINLAEAEHTSYVCHLVRHIRGQQRLQWPDDAVHLRVTLVAGADIPDGRPLEEAFQLELAAALRVPAACVAAVQVERPPPAVRASTAGRETVHVRFELRAAIDVDAPAMEAGAGEVGRDDASSEPWVKAGTSGTTSSFHADSDTDDELDARQRAMAMHRRIEALAAALRHIHSAMSALKDGGMLGVAPPTASTASGDPAVGAGIVSMARSLARGSITRLVDAAAGLEYVEEDGKGCRVLVLSAATPLVEISSSGLALGESLDDYATTSAQREHVRGCLADRSSLITIGGLAKGIRGGKALSLGDAYVQFCHFFKVFSAWSFNLESARNRIDACKKLDDFRHALNQAQLDPRSERADILNWLNRPNQHLMRQPLLLENLRDRTRKARPACPTIPVLELALNTMRSVVFDIDAKKLDYEMRGRLVDVSARLQGLADHTPLIMPHRQLLKEGDLIEVSRTPPLDAPPPLDAAGVPPTGAPARPLANCTPACGVEFSTPKYAFLCNDTFWYCESHRGNRYTLLHVFNFGATKASPPDQPPGMGSGAGGGGGGAADSKRTTRLTRKPSLDRLAESIDEIITGGANSRPQRTRASAAVYSGADGTFWLSDDKMAVQLRARGTGTPAIAAARGSLGAEVDAWLSIAMGASKAMGVKKRRLAKALGERASETEIDDV